MSDEKDSRNHPDTKQSWVSAWVDEEMRKISEKVQKLEFGKTR